MDKEIYHLSWNEDSFSAKLRLFLKSWWRESNRIWDAEPINRWEKAQGYSALSSTFYSIAGTARAQIIQNSFKIWWILLGAWCYWRMLPLSNKVVELIGYEGMTADMCDIRQSILRRQGRLKEARECIRFGYIKDAKNHTLGLLHVGDADVCKQEGDWQGAQVHMNEALRFAEKAVGGNPQQAIRIYRKAADIVDWLEAGRPGDSGAPFRRKAEKIARETDAKDQLLKLKTN